MAPSNPTPILHLYRHLLREAGYLPPTCQSYAAKRIKAQFRHHRSEPPAAPETRRHIKRAQHDLRYLRAANHGHMDNMWRILLLTFGRIGRRRRELIAELVRKEPPGNTAELAKQMEETSKETSKTAILQGKTTRPDEDRKTTLKPLRPDFLDKWDLEKLDAFANSQSNSKLECNPRPEIKPHKLDPLKEIPKENVFGRPLAKTLHRSKLRKWYKAFIHRILPPIPRAEWETLRLLATGQADKSLWMMPARRPMAVSSQHSNGDGKKNWDWESYATMPTRAVERKSSRSQKLRTGATDDGPFDRVPVGIHTYSPRFWKRIYTRIWELTATMEKQERASPNMNRGPARRWAIQWGKASKGVSDIPLATDAQLEFFEVSLDNSTKTVATARGR